jgi:hypothetical protein
MDGWVISGGGVCNVVPLKALSINRLWEYKGSAVICMALITACDAA